MSYGRHITSTLLAVFLVFGAVLAPQFVQAQSAENECTDSPDFVITSNKQAYALVGESFSYYVVTQNNTSYELDSELPTGINFVGGQLYGTPESAGSYPLNFTATNPCGTTTQTVTLTVVESSSGAVAQTSETDSGTTDSSSQSASANEVGLNEIPDTGLAADTALTVGFYILALLLLAGWFTRRLAFASNDGGGSGASPRGYDLPERGNFIPSRQSRGASRQSQNRRFGDGVRR